MSLLKLIEEDIRVCHLKKKGNKASKKELELQNKILIDNLLDMDRIPKNRSLERIKIKERLQKKLNKKVENMLEDFINYNIEINTYNSESA